MVYNVLGKKVWTKAPGSLLPAGEQTLVWNGCNKSRDCGWCRSVYRASHCPERAGTGDQAVSPAGDVRAVVHPALDEKA